MGGAASLLLIVSTSSLVLCACGREFDGQGYEVRADGGPAGMGREANQTDDEQHSEREGGAALSSRPDASSSETDSSLDEEPDSDGNQGPAGGAPRLPDAGDEAADGGPPPASTNAESDPETDPAPPSTAAVPTTIPDAAAAGPCASYESTDGRIVDDFSNPCSLDYWEVQTSEALTNPLLLDGLRLELRPDAAMPWKEWWGSSNGPFVYRLVESDGFVVRTEVRIESSRLDGATSSSAYQLGGLVVAVPAEFMGEWVFNGVGFVNGTGRDCPDEGDMGTVGVGSQVTFTEWTESTSCVGASGSSRVEAAICRYEDRVAAFQRPVAENASGDSRPWSLIRSGTATTLQGSLRVGLAVSVPQQDPAEVVAHFPWVAIDTQGIRSFDDCSLPSFQARYGD